MSKEPSVHVLSRLLPLVYLCIKCMRELQNVNDLNKQDFHIRVEIVTGLHCLFTIKRFKSDTFLESGFDDNHSFRPRRAVLFSDVTFHASRTSDFGPRSSSRV